MRSHKGESRLSFLQTLTAYGSDSSTSVDLTWNNCLSTAGADDYIVGWTGQERSIFDGYEWEEDRNEHAAYSVDTNDWPHRIQWGNDFQSWIKVTIGADTVTNITAATTDVKQFYFYYTWHGAQSFGPICEEQEVAPETFMKWLEKIGHDYAFLRMNHRMQKRMMKDIGHIPPWDPRKIAQLEEKRVRLREHMEELEFESKANLKQRMKERWGIEDIPPITPELLDQIADKSLQFLESCLSPEEMKFFDEHGHCKIPSPTEPEVYYIVKVRENDRVERYEQDELAEKICIHSKWSGLPPLDTVAMKALYIKNAEKEFLKVGNRTRVTRR